MKSKLKFLLPDIATAHQVAGSLMLASVDNEDISFLAKPGTDLGQLQAANIIESTKIINEDEKDRGGILIGAVIGLLTGAFIHYIYPSITTSMGIHWIVIVAIATLLGALASMICAAVFRVNFFGAKVKKYKDKIESGAILMIVTTPFRHTNEIRLIVSKSYLKY